MYIQIINGVTLSINVLQSASTSSLPPLLDADWTSTFFALSSSRLYNFYPKLYRRQECFKIRTSTNVNQFDFRGKPLPLPSFNFGLLAHTRVTDSCPPQCDEACFSGLRRTFGLPQTEVFRWGGYKGRLDRGFTVSPSDGYDMLCYVWSMGSGQCYNTRCINFIRRRSVFA